MVTTTTVYGFQKPTVAGDEDDWGGYLNNNIDKYESILTGNTTITSLVITTADINGGTLDNVVIGGTTAAAITGTTITASGNIVVSGTVDGRDIATDGAKLDGIESGATADQTKADIDALGIAASTATTAGTVTTAAQPNITSLGTLTTLTVDDITINGSTISDASHLTIDVGGNIDLDADGGIVRVRDAGTHIGSLYNSTSDFAMYSAVQDKDILFQGNDGGSTITALTLDMSDAGTATFNNHIVMQEDHFINRRFEVDVSGTTIYILLCVNAANNDVNGTITMDRTSGLRFACSWDIIVSSGSGAAPVGSLIGHSVAGSGTPSARLVTLTYSSVSYVALELTNPDQYYESTGAYFTGRIVNSGSNTLVDVASGSVSSVSKLSQGTGKTAIGSQLDIDGDLNAVNNIYVADNIYHEGDTDTSINFGTDTITLQAGGSAEVTVTTTGVQLGDTGNGYFQPVSGTYGSIQIDGGAHNGWEGYSIGGYAVFMSDSANSVGLYNDSHNQWWFRGFFNGQAYMYNAGVNKLNTHSSGVNVEGDINAVDNIYLASGLIHEGDTDTYLGFSTNAINLYTGGTLSQFSSSGLFITDGSLAEDYDALSGTTPTCNVDNGGMFSLTMTGNTTFTFSGASSGYIQGFVLQLTGNGSTVTWPTSVDWAGGTAPDAPGNGETDILVFITRDGGTNWYGALAIDAAA
jgi:hypothetical protein